MHLVVIICIIFAVIGLIISIIVGIKAEPIDGFLMFLFLDVIVAGLIGFGATCSVISWNETYTKLSPDKIENHIFKDGIIASVYDKKLYLSTKIQDLNAINEIDYYLLENKYNAYGINISNTLHPIKKRNEYDYIKEK